MASGTRLSAQNYCYHCLYRVKEKQSGKTFCLNDGYRIPIMEAMKTCPLLVPFENYRIEKEKDEKKGVPYKPKRM